MAVDPIKYRARSHRQSGHEANDEHTNRIKFALLCADEAGHAKSNDANGFDEWEEFNDCGREHDGEIL